MLNPTSRRRTEFLLLALFVWLVCILSLWPNRTIRTDWVDFASDEDILEDFSTPKPSASEHEEPLPCRDLPGGDDILLLVKTGATEAHRKLPVHFKTTFRCARHYAIFSDMEEEIKGEIVHDALAEIDDEVKRTNIEFEFYRQMQELHEAGGDMNEMIVDDLYKKAWNLDKWKFLPIAEKALKTRPESKWFVFTEADTHVVWPNLLQWLAQFDPEKPLYIGAQNWIGSTVFAHGGAGYIVSHTALERVVEEYTTKRSFYNELTATEWAGDLVLSKAFINVGIAVTPTWPITQVESISSLDYTELNWCFPVASHHHMSPGEIEAMFRFEQSWLSKHPNNDEPIHHYDVFDHFFAKRISEIVVGWDNFAEQEEASEENSTFEDCRELCIQKEDCLQWAHSPGKCSTSRVIRLGQELPHSNTVSGWISDRIQHFMQEQESCSQGWIVES